MDLEKEIEALKKRIKLLEEFQELKKKVEELEKQTTKPNEIYIPYPVYPTYPRPWREYPYYPSPYYGTVTVGDTGYLSGGTQSQ